jgi:4-amino-4-deoxy-L-arabinose transferase-like glycosyltransferase
LANIAVLGAILLTAFALRSFNLNFPSIGYHNLNENEYLIAAQQMKQPGASFTDKTYCRNIFDRSADRYHSQPPLVSCQILLAWKLFDENLWGPRLLNILFGVLSVLTIYGISRILFKDKIRALVTCLLLAIMPLAVFFSRNLQPESPALFFMALSNLFYLRFASSFKKYNLLISGLSLSMACLYNFNFFITIVPFILCFPFKRYIKDRKASIKTALIVLFSVSPLMIGAIWLMKLHWHNLFLFGKIRPLDIFTASYWAGHGREIWWYARQENFTIVYILLALAGAAAAFFKRSGKDLINRYLMGWAFGLVIYGIVYSDYIFENNFSQMPFLLPVCISAVYAVSSASDFLKKYFKRDIFLACMLIAVSVSVPFVSKSIVRMYGTAFLGADVAGESLHEFTKDGDTVFLSGHIQGYGIVRYSGRPAGWTDNLDEFRQREKEFNIKYACFYPAENLFRIKTENMPLFEYIQENYHIKEVGLTEEPFRLYYVILERGNGSDLEASLKSLNGIKEIKNIYRSFDNYIFFYVIRTVREKTRPGK